MNRLSKLMVAGLGVAAMTGTALAQDPPADPATDPATTTEPAADPPTEPEPAPSEPSEPAEVSTAGGKGKVLGVDAVFVLPLSDYADGSNAGIGALGRFELGLNPMLAITFRAGLIYNLAKDGIDTFLLIPVHAGAKYMIGTSGLFAQAELGVTHYRISPGDIAETKFSFEAGAGFQRGQLSARAGFYYIAEDPALQGIMASVGFDFASL